MNQIEERKNQITDKLEKVPHFAIFNNSKSNLNYFGVGESKFKSATGAASKKLTNYKQYR